MGDAGFLGRQRIDEVKVWLALLEENTQNLAGKWDVSLWGGCVSVSVFIEIPGGMWGHCLWENCLMRGSQQEDLICC